MEQVLMSAKGITGQLELFDDRVKIKRRTGIYAILTQGFRADKNIPISEISSVVLRRAGTLNGYIEIVLEGRAPKEGLLEAALDANAITFKLRHQAAFEDLKAAIEEKMAVVKSGETCFSSTDDAKVE